MDDLPMDPQALLIARLRTLLTDAPAMREVSMFGARSFLVNEKMIVSAGKNGDLLVRVPADQHERLLRRSGARQAEMGAGRDMGPGWIEVTGSAISEDEPLGSWLKVALDHNRTVTGSSH